MHPAVALYGRSGSGKSTIAALLVEEYGFTHYKTGGACRELCLALFGSEDKTLLNRVTDALRDIDELVWLRAALKSADRTRERVVLDSIRFEPDYRYVTRHHFVTLAVEAPAGTRIARLRARGQAYDETLDDRHAAEAELEHFDFDYRISNEGSREELTAKVHAFASDLNL